MAASPDKQIRSTQVQSSMPTGKRNIFSWCFFTGDAPQKGRLSMTKDEGPKISMPYKSTNRKFYLIRKVYHNHPLANQRWIDNTLKSGRMLPLVEIPAIRSPSTRNKKEIIAWRQWHHWNRIDNLTIVKLKKGKHLLTIKTITNGNMNYDYLNFALVK